MSPKIFLFWSIVLLWVILMCKLIFGQDVQIQKSEPRDILLIDHLHGHWLTVARINHSEPGGEFNPNWTYIRTQGGIIPIITKHGDVYSITFTTELTKNLP